MTATDAVTAAVDVAVDPDAAFEVFTGEIGSWYRRNRFTVFDVSRSVDVRFEPQAGGRLLDVYDAATGEGREMGRVVVWEPGRRLVFTETTPPRSRCASNRSPVAPGHPRAPRLRPAPGS